MPSKSPKISGPAIRSINSVKAEMHDIAKTLKLNLAERVIVKYMIQKEFGQLWHEMTYRVFGEAVGLREWSAKRNLNSLRKAGLLQREKVPLKGEHYFFRWRFRHDTELMAKAVEIVEIVRNPENQAVEEKEEVEEVSEERLEFRRQMWEQNR